MSVKACPNGHHYNTEDNPSCPYCEQNVSNSAFDWNKYSDSSFRDYSDNTMYINTNNHDNNPGNNYDDSSDKTEYINTGGTEKPNSNSGPSPDNSFPGRNRRPDGFDSDSSDDNNKTQISGGFSEYQQQPVVGWLVCIEGPDKGKDFCLHGAKSSIGRRRDCAILLSDNKISREGIPALIVYDNRKTHNFYLASGDAASHNNVELEGNLLLGQSLINPYDTIRIEDTLLVFVPFCGETFYWKEM